MKINLKLFLVFLILIMPSIFYIVYKNKNTDKPEKIIIAMPNNKDLNKFEKEKKIIQETFSKYLKNINVELVQTEKNLTNAGFESGKIQAGFLMYSDYVILKDKEIVFSNYISLRNEIDSKTGSEKNKKNDFYKSYLLTKNNSKINSLKDLEGKNICSPNSSSSYSQTIIPTIYLNKLINFEKIKFTKGGFATTLINKVLNNKCDGAFIYEDARLDLLQTNKNIFKQTKVIEFEKQKTPNDVFVINSKINNKIQKAINSAFERSLLDKKFKDAFYKVYKINNFKKHSDEYYKEVKNNIEKFKKIEL